MYASIEEVRQGIKNEVLSDLLGNQFIEDEQEREQRFITVIEDAIIDADGEIDGYLNKRYSVPLRHVPKIINKLSKDIAQYNIFSRVGIDEGSREKTYLSRYEAAIKFLREVATGVIELPILTDEQTASTLKADYRVNSSRRLFNRQSMRRF